MQHFDKIYERAAARKGGAKALEDLLAPTETLADLRSLTDSDVLAEMTACVFRAGFVWRVVTAKWPGFLKAFNDFDVTQCAMLSDEDIEKFISVFDEKSKENTILKFVPASGAASRMFKELFAFAENPTENSKVTSLLENYKEFAFADEVADFLAKNGPKKKRNIL